MAIVMKISNHFQVASHTKPRLNELASLMQQSKDVLEKRKVFS